MRSIPSPQRKLCVLMERRVKRGPITAEHETLSGVPPHLRDSAQGDGLRGEQSLIPTSRVLLSPFRPDYPITFYAIRFTPHNTHTAVFDLPQKAHILVGEMLNLFPADIGGANGRTSP